MSLSRSHAGKVKGNGARVQGGHPAGWSRAPWRCPQPVGKRVPGSCETSRVSANDRPTGQPTAPHDSAFLKACRREPVPHTPVWFMRQAGRSLPEYRKVREGIAMLDSCMRPDLVTEITLQPVRRYGVDAAIFYSDIVVPLKAIGVDLDIVPGVGPVVAQPFTTRADLDRLP